MGEGRRPLVWPRPQGFRVIGDGFWKDRRSPTMGEGELIAKRRRLADLLLGPDLAARVYGSLPKED